WTSPVKLGGDINKPDSWEGSVTITKDGHTIYFSSDRAGGFGGKDIYSATLIGDSTFGNVTNLGANVNTEFDDDAPFLGNNENTLYFSSRGHNSIGGYDIFFSGLGADGKTWELAQNMGSPVNSTADDIFYQPSKDGYSAVFSSNRSGGNGLMDLYFSSPGVPATELVTIKGMVTLDEKPVAATVTVAYTNKSDIQGDYNTSADNGKYTINLPQGENYKLYFMVSGQDDYSKTYDATDVKTYTTNEINVEFFSDEYKMAHPEKFGKMSAKDSANVAAIKKNTQIIDTKSGIRTVNDSSSHFTMEDNTTPVDPGFYIVIGSFKNLDYAKRMEAKVAMKPQYPKVQLVYNKKNGFTYVTVGHPESLEASIKLAREARKEYSDAWIQNLH
ncbi:MAG TPA: SPOR domain-containing protein, partial [Bacteroidia bacterium]|nr:SPOR domain-containing protein [Bacteroidia bacterium]